MKLLTTIAAVLISISAYSQDYIEYDNGTFTQNGEQLSMEQVKGLVNHFNVGGPKFRRAKKCLRLAQKRNPGVRNALNGIGGVAAGLVSPIFVAVGVDFLIDGGNKQTFEFRANKKFNKVADKLNEAIKASNQ